MVELTVTSALSTPDLTNSVTSSPLFLSFNRITPLCAGTNSKILSITFEKTLLRSVSLVISAVAA